MANQKSASDKEREQRSANEKAEREQRRANESAQRDERRRKEESSRNTKSVSSGPTKRQEAKAAAKEYDIDTKGLSTREINRAVSEQKEIEDDMVKFIEKTLDKFTAKKGDDVAPADAPVAVTSRSTEVSAPPLRSSGSGGGQQRPQIPEEEEPFPFKISIAKNKSFFISKNSSIIDGINGEPFTIKGGGRVSTQSPYIVAEAQIDTEDKFEIKDKEFILKAVGEDELNEVVVDEKGVQTKLRLLIGEVVGLNSLYPEPRQAVYTSFKVIYSFYNGQVVFALAPAATHSSLVDY